jgi:tetratricopeptide (TPR) repeat protein/uncharacterized protein HemY
MRKLNVRFALCLLAALAVLGGGIALAHQLQARRIPVALLKQARTAEDKNELKRAASYLARYLSFVPDDPEQHARLAHLLATPRLIATTRGKANAYHALLAAIRYNPDGNDLRQLFVPLAIDLGRLNQAASQLKDMGKDPRVSALWGKWYEAKLQTDQAIASYSAAVKAFPKETENYVRLARLLRSRAWLQLSAARATQKRQIDRNKADQVMAALIAANGESWQARLARWNYRRDYCLRAPDRGTHSRFVEGVLALVIKDAAGDVEKALQLAAGEPEVRLAAAEAAQLRGDIETAREHLSRALQLHRKDPRVYRAFAGLELQREGQADTPEEKKKARERALSWMRQGIKELTGAAQFDVLWAHASLLIDTGGDKELGEAAGVIARIEKTVATPEGVAGADFLRGRLLFARQQWPEAVRLLERARPRLEGASALANQLDALLGRCYVELDEYTQQWATYRRLARRDPTSVVARAGMANAARALGRMNDALKLYEELGRMPGAPEGIWAEQARLLILRAREGNRASDWKTVEDALSQAATRGADAAEVAILRAESLMAQEKPDRARQILEKARDRDPFRVELWTALATLAERGPEPEKALAILDRAGRQEELKQRPADQVALRLARARFWAARRTEQVPGELKKLEAGLDSFPSRERAQLINGLADAYYQADRYADAARLWRSLTQQEKYRGSLRLRLVLFDLSQQKGNEREMRRLVDEMRSLEGKSGPFGNHAEALCLLWRVKQGKTSSDRKAEALDRAARLVERVRSARPSWSAALLTQAEIEIQRGNPDQAIKYYEEARTLGDRNPMVLHRFVDVLRQNGRIQQADELLRNLKPADLARADLKREAARISLLRGDSARAIDLALTAVRNDSRDYRDHLWLGQMLASSGPRHARKAEEHLRRAIQLADTEPEPYVALVGLLTREKRNLVAEGFIEQVQKRVKAAQRETTLARCYSLLGRPEEARKRYEATLRAHPDDARVLRDYANFRLQRQELPEAEALLRKFLARGKKLSDEDGVWAHTRLALILSADGDFAHFKEALTHVGLRLEDSGAVVADNRLISVDSVELRRQAAHVLATRSQWQTREEAIKRLEELDRRQALTADDRYVLAHLYEARNDWSRCWEQMRQLARAHDREPHHLVGFAQALIRHGHLAEARGLLDDLEKEQAVKPTPALALAVVELEGRLYEVQGEGARADRILQAAIDQPGADPQAILLLVSSLARRKQFDRALELLDRVWKNCPPEMAGGTSVALLRAANKADGRRKQVVAWLEAAIKKDTKSSALHVQLGDVKDLQNDFEGAERAYREALALDPKNVVALNNLAWLLAERARRGQDAMPLINKAIAVGGPRGELLDTRAMVFLSLGRTDEAIRDLKEAMKESPTPTRCFHLARVYHQAKNREAAARELKRATDLGLQPAQLHPVEQVEHGRLVRELIRR